MKTPLEALNELGDSSSLDETERNNLETIIRSAIKKKESDQIVDAVCAKLQSRSAVPLWRGSPIV